MTDTRWYSAMLATNILSLLLGGIICRFSQDVMAICVETISRDCEPDQTLVRFVINDLWY